MKKVKVYFFMMFIVQILFFTACERNNKTLTNNEKINEEVVFKEQHNPELDESAIFMSLTENDEDEIVFVDSFSQDVYLLEEGKIVFYFDNSYNEEDANIEDWYIEKNKNGEQIYKVYLSDIEGITTEKFSGEYVDWDVGAWWPAKGGEIYPLINGNVMLTIHFDRTIKVLEIDPFTKELVNSVEHELYTEEGDYLNVLFITEKHTVFTNDYEGNIFFYNNSTGEIDIENKSPGCEKDEDFGTSKFGLYDRYWYTVNDTGIYRTKYEELNWECIISASEAKHIAYNPRNYMPDIFVVNQKEIYVLKVNEFNDEGTEETVRIIKYEIY